MSAWIVQRVHIDALVQALAEGEIVTDVDPNEIGRTLWRENVKSIHARYPDTEENDTDYPGPFDFCQVWVDDYLYSRPVDRLSNDALLKQVNCYQYQTCEHEEWPSSVAHRWIIQLTEALERAGASRDSEAYSAAPWGLNPTEVSA